MRSILLLLLAFPYSSPKCLDGRLIEKVPFVPADSIVQAIAKTVPDIKSVLSSVNLYRITYLSDGLKVKGYLAVPKKQGNYPCIIHNRGGSKDYGKLTDKSFTRHLSEISSKGYVIIASQYRGNDGGEGQEEFGGKDVDDVLNLIPLLSQVPSADTSRIGMMCWSKGGMMTYIALTKTTRIKAAVVGSGVTDLIKALETRPEFDTTVYEV